MIFSSFNNNNMGLEVTRPDWPALSVWTDGHVWIGLFFELPLPRHELESDRTYTHIETQDSANENNENVDKTNL